METRITAVINQKGGVGKSTTAAALLAGLAQMGVKCLGVDLDAQGNFSYMAGASVEPGLPTILGVLLRETSSREAAQRLGRWDFIPSSKELSGADGFIRGGVAGFRLREALAPLIGRYHHIIIDTPPSLGILTVNALTACNGVVVPTTADLFSMQGVDDLAHSIGEVRRYCNPELKMDGILLTMFAPRTVLSRDLAELTERMAERLGTRVFSSRIREAVAVREAQVRQKTIFEYAPKAKVTADYQAFIEEFLKTAEG